MTEPVSNEVDVPESQTDADADALSSAIAGYNNKGQQARGETPPAGPVDIPQGQIDPASGEIKEPPPPTEAERLSAELAGLKAQVSSLKDSSDPESIRRMHGEIGNINRTLKQLQTSGMPSSPELDAILKEAEDAAEEFPELAAPMLKAIKALAMHRPAPIAQTDDIDERVSATELQKVRERDAINALTEEHPDWVDVRNTPEFSEWLKSKTPEYQEKFNNTWNPAVVSRGLSEFKESLKARERKQTRLAAAVAPTGVPAPATPSTIPDEQGAFIGYNKGPKRLNMR